MKVYDLISQNLKWCLLCKSVKVDDFFCNYSYIVFGCFYEDIRNKTKAYKISTTLRLPCFLVVFFFSHRNTYPTRKITVGGVRNIT